MKITPPNLNIFMLFKLPSAFFTGVRLRKITNEIAVVKVTHRWVNQNPFNSLYYGVQAMAAELSTGALVMKKIQESGQVVSMLVTKQTATFTKKGRGRMAFVCEDGKLIDEKLKKTLENGEGQVIVLKSVAKDAQGDVVSTFEFEWSIKLKQKTK
jgi:acyl-coenzyme A thioesterase PaaI-like protein